MARVSFTVYKNSTAATLLSALGSLILYGGILLAVVGLIGLAVPGILAGIIVALGGFGLEKLAARIAASKTGHKGKPKKQ